METIFSTSFKPPKTRGGGCKQKKMILPISVLFIVMIYSYCYILKQHIHPVKRQSQLMSGRP